MLTLSLSLDLELACSQLKSLMEDLNLHRNSRCIVEITDLLRLELGGVGEGRVPDLVEGIGTVRDELSKEDLLVGVEGVDDEIQQLRDLGLVEVRTRASEAEREWKERKGKK